MDNLFEAFDNEDDISNAISEIEALKDELKVCDDDSERELIIGDIRSLKKRIVDFYTDKRELKKINRNVDYRNRMHNRRLAYAESKKLNEFLDDDEILFYKDDSDYDSDYDYNDYDYDDDDTFYEGGNEYRWVDDGFTYQECINGTCWEAREAYNVDNGESVYFVVDTDTDEIDWECGTPDEAVDFIQAKYDDIEDDDYYDFDDIDEDEYYAYFTREDESYHLEPKYELDYNDYDDGYVVDYYDEPLDLDYGYKYEYESMDEIHDDFEIARKEFKKIFPNLAQFFDWLLELFNNSEYAEPDFYAYPIYSRDGWNKFIKFVRTEVLKDETTGVGSIGQHKRSSIDLINPEDDNEELDRFDIDENDMDDFELLVEDGDIEDISDEDFIELDLVDDTEMETDTTDTDTEDDTTDDTIDTADTDNSDELELDSDTVDGNIDGKDSTSPMDNSKPKRTGTNKIDI